MNIKRLVISFLFIIFLPLFILNCKSNSLPIPGQNKVVTENLNSEYLKLGDAYFSIEKYDEAILCYEKAKEYLSLYSSCQYKIGKCYVFQKNWGKAVPIFIELLEMDPENSELKASLAYIYSMSGLKDKALSLYNELIAIQPGNEKYLENYLAVILADKKFFAQNLSDFEIKFNQFKIDFPENKNIKAFQEKYNEYIEEKK